MTSQTMIGASTVLWAPLLFAAVVALSPTASAVVKLTSFNFNIASNSITTSGVSAGGYMAVQFHVAHSRFVKGSASFAAGPWFCAQDSLAFAEEKCMKVRMPRFSISHTPTTHTFSPPAESSRWPEHSIPGGPYHVGGGTGYRG